MISSDRLVEGLHGASFRRGLRIGEILLKTGLITEEVLAEALEYQKTFGGNISQYLVKYGFITETDLAWAICATERCPYLPLDSFDISDEVKNLIPAYLAEKYWLIPVDRMGDVITVVMANPCDKRVIKEIEDVTGCAVQPFVGIVSDIARAIERYYDVDIKHKELEKERRIAPLFIRGTAYHGLDRRKAERINVGISVRFSADGVSGNAETLNISRYGILFESNIALPVGSCVKMRMDAPGKMPGYQFEAMVEVARVAGFGRDMFLAGAKVVDMKKEDADRMVSYSVKLSKDLHFA